MSGICALVTFHGGAVEQVALERMAAAAAHRGAEGTAAWTGEGAGLVQQLLPIGAYDRPGPPPRAAGLVAVADARLDNRRELSAHLLRGGAIVEDATATDAEVILAAYRLWGDACPAKLIGDFAFVIFDERRRRLFAARDPLGMRPLYHRVEPRRRVLVSSEIKQLLAGPNVPCDIDELGIASTLAGPYLPADRTVYAGIAQLAPGHALAVDACGSRTWRYWRPDPHRLLDCDDATCAALFREALAESVAARMGVGRPVGIFLSGGMDSGAIASTAGWLRERGVVEPVSLHAYSWAFHELSDSDERGVSDLVVAHYGLDATAVPADDAWPLAGYPDHGPDRDDPYCWVYQALIERTLERCRAEGMRVILGGDRGDELTGDWVYDELGLLLAGRARDALADVRRAAADTGLPAATAVRRAVVRPLLEACLPRPVSAVRRVCEHHTPWLPWVDDALARRVDLGDVIADACKPARFDGPSRTLRAGRVFMAQGARIAVLQNRTRARYGMGFADPFSDRRLVELVLSLPQWRVQRRGAPKQLARAAMAGVMPELARNKAAKTFPLGLFDRGFRDRAVDVVEGLLSDSRAAANGWLDAEVVRAVYDEYRTIGDTAHDFWWPLCVEMWLRRWWN